MNPVILFRKSFAEDNEVYQASKYFPVYFQHEKIPPGSLVIPRYSSLPYFEYLEAGIKELGSELINTYRQHRYVADIQNWYYDLEMVTPATWFKLEDVPQRMSDYGSYVLKGETNSRKFQWDTHMFARTYADITKVHSNLLADSLIGSQNICIRRYVPLRQVGTRIDGRPVTEEYRIFILDGKVLTKDFYWSEYYDVVEFKDQDHHNIPQDLIDYIIESVGDSIRFYVADVARTNTGKWIVIELNCGGQSGLSLCDPAILYENMSKILHE